MALCFSRSSGTYFSLRILSLGLTYHMTHNSFFNIALTGSHHIVLNYLTILKCLFIYLLGFIYRKSYNLQIITVLILPFSCLCLEFIFLITSSRMPVNLEKEQWIVTFVICSWLKKNTLNIPMCYLYSLYQASEVLS